MAIFYPVQNLTFTILILSQKVNLILIFLFSLVPESCCRVRLIKNCSPMILSSSSSMWSKGDPANVDISSWEGRPFLDLQCEWEVANITIVEKKLWLFTMSIIRRLILSFRAEFSVALEQCYLEVVIILALVWHDLNEERKSLYKCSILK